MIESIGFTGTRLGMSVRQRQGIETLLWLLQPKEVHHGDCIGADEQFHRIAQQMKLRIIIHPPDNQRLQANCLFDPGDKKSFRMASKPYLERNVDIVNASDILLGAPGTSEEMQHSGTWMTIRHARGLKKNVIVIYPEGNIEHRGVR